MTKNLSLAFALAVAPIVAIACGGAQPAPAGPEGVPTASASPSSSAAPSGAPSEGAALPSPAPSSSAAVAGPPVTIGASAMAADLQAIGLDLKALPQLEKMEPDKLRKVMKTFTKALGVKCTGCHASDYKAVTPMKKIAQHMWDDFTRNLAMENGTPMYCDSCHQGRAKILDRHDKKALSAWMDTNLVAKMKRRDGKEHSCETCHGDPFEGDILAGWTK
jgi:hypothetical protein